MAAGIKVFISSIIEDYKEQRRAAREALEMLSKQKGFRNLNIQPIMVEKDYPALDKSPQKACLEGVENCQIFLGIYGRKYGSIMESSGWSASHEEYERARELIKVCLIFTEKVSDLEPRQEEFMKEVEGWVTGSFRASFGNLEGLILAIENAFRNLKDEKLLARLLPPTAKARILI